MARHPIHKAQIDHDGLFIAEAARDVLQDFKSSLREAYPHIEMRVVCIVELKHVPSGECRVTMASDAPPHVAIGMMARRIDSLTSEHPDPDLIMPAEPNPHPGRTGKPQH